MTILPASLDYTDKDFDALKARLEALASSVFPDWTDFNVADFANILSELFCFVGDVNSKYQDNQARESRWGTASQRKNLIALAKLIGFIPAGATAARTNETFRLASVPTHDVTFPAGTVVETSDVTDAVSFQLLADLTIPANTNPPVAVGLVENSTSRSRSFTSNGLANQSFVIPDTPYLDGSASITAGNGAYTEVDDFLASTSSDRHFTVTVDQNDRATILFGNGVNGAIPTGVIGVGLKTGGGSAGNVEPGDINQIPGSFTDSVGNPVQVSVTNAQQAQGGTERMSVQTIRQRAPQTTRLVGGRCVAREDFEISAKKVPGVARVLMTTSNEDPGVPENTGILYVIPSGGGLPSDSLKADVLTQVTVTELCTLTFRPLVQSPSYKTIDVDVTAYVKRGVAKNVMAADIRAAMKAYFQITNADGSENTNVDWGLNNRRSDGTPDPRLSINDVLIAARAVASVAKIDGNATGFLLNGKHTDVVLLAREFPKLGNVTVRDGETGSLLLWRSRSRTRASRPPRRPRTRTAGRSRPRYRRSCSRRTPATSAFARERRSSSDGAATRSLPISSFRRTPRAPSTTCSGRRRRPRRSSADGRETRRSSRPFRRAPLSPRTARTTSTASRRGRRTSPRSTTQTCPRPSPTASSRAGRTTRT